jgi:hypothetical protein
MVGKRTHIDARLLQHGRPPYTRLLDLERKLRQTKAREADSVPQARRVAELQSRPISLSGIQKKTPLAVSWFTYLDNVVW